MRREMVERKTVIYEMRVLGEGPDGHSRFGSGDRV